MRTRGFRWSAGSQGLDVRVENYTRACIRTRSTLTYYTPIPFSPELLRHRAHQVGDVGQLVPPGGAPAQHGPERREVEGTLTQEPRVRASGLLLMVVVVVMVVGMVVVMVADDGFGGCDGGGDSGGEGGG